MTISESVRVLLLVFPLFVGFLANSIDQLKRENESLINAESKRVHAEENRLALAENKEQQREGYVGFVEHPQMPNLKWTGSVEAAVQESRKTGKRILLMFDSENSIYAAKNRVTIGKLPAMQQALKGYVLLVLYIDAIPPIYFTKATSSEWSDEAAKANQKSSLMLFKSQASLITPWWNPRFSGR